MKVTRGALVLVLVAAGLLGGCSTHPGAAATINGVELSQATVDAFAREISTLGGTRANALSVGATLTAIAPVISTYAAKEGADFHEGAYVSCAQSIGVEVSDSSTKLLRDYCLYYQLLAMSNREFSAEVDAAIAKMNVNLSPRYGVGDTLGQIPNFLTKQDRHAASDSQSKALIPQGRTTTR